MMLIYGTASEFWTGAQSAWSEIMIANSMTEVLGKTLRNNRSSKIY